MLYFAAFFPFLSFLQQLREGVEWRLRGPELSILHQRRTHVTYLWPSSSSSPRGRDWQREMRPCKSLGKGGGNPRVTSQSLAGTLKLLSIRQGLSHGDVWGITISVDLDRWSIYVVDFILYTLINICPFFFSLSPFFFFFLSFEAGQAVPSVMQMSLWSLFWSNAISGSLFLCCCSPPPPILRWIVCHGYSPDPCISWNGFTFPGFSFFFFFCQKKCIVSPRSCF